MHILRHWALVALVGITLTIGACTTVSQEQRLQDVCSVYERTLTTLTGFAIEGELSKGQIQTVDNVRIIMNEVCYGNVDNVQDALKRASDGMKKLIDVRREVQ